MSAHTPLAIAPQIPVADINDDPYFRHLLALAYKNAATGQELAACVNAWHKAQLDRYRRSPPGVGLSNDRLLDLAAQAGVTGDGDKLVAYGRSVLGAASHPTPLLAAAVRASRSNG